MSSLAELRAIAKQAKAKDPSKAKVPRTYKDNRAGYLFLLPWLVGLFGFTAGPMLASLFLSFTDYNLLESPGWIGLDNFARMWGDDRFWQSLEVTLVYVFVSVPMLLVLALAVAVLLDRGMRGLPFYRTVFYLPSLMGARWPSRSCGVRCSGWRAWSTDSSRSSGSRGRAGSPTRTTRCGPW